jgi:predicted dienelactone hydrolase
MRIKSFIFILLFAVTSLDAMTKCSAPSKTHREIRSVGVKTLEYIDLQRNERPVLVEVWYPTLKTGSSDEVRDAPLAASKSKYPLILMSHGHGGERRDLSWLAEQLAFQGYVVASVEHFGNALSTYCPVKSLRFWERPLDVTFTLDRLIGESFLQGKIDEGRIGFVGYSLGGMTGLALGGAKAQNVKEIALYLQDKYKEISREIVEETDFSMAPHSYADPRVKAMVLLCPATFIYPPQSLSDVKVELGLVAAINDQMLPHEEHALKK